MPEHHEIEVIQMANGKIGLIIGRGDDLAASRRMSREEAFRVGSELCRASGSPPPESNTHHGRTHEEAEPTEPEEKEIPKKIRMERQAAELEEAIRQNTALTPTLPFEEINCHVCGTPTGERKFKDKKGRPVHRHCQNVKL